MGKSINESLALLGEAARLNGEITKFFGRCFGSDEYKDLPEVEDIAVEAMSVMLLDGDVEITLWDGCIIEPLQSVFHEAVKTKDQETAAEASSLLCQLATLERKIGGKK